MTGEPGQQSTVRMLAGRYAVLGEIGRGGMGVVWRGEDRVIGRPVAIKELRLPDGLPDSEREVYTERVLREARAAGRLNDPAVITVYDVLAEHGVTYIVMELVEAPTLRDLVHGQGPLPVAAVASIGKQVLSALDVAHAAGIVHRDVKPGNIMVAPNGRVKLTDFGIAQALDDPRLTVSGSVVGSPAFMAPERVAEQEMTHASDLWSLGATLFTAVEGYAPFERSSTAATLHAIMNDVPYLTRCQGPLASAIMGMLIPDPNARLASARVGPLLELVASQQAPVGPPTPTYGYTRQRGVLVGGAGSGRRRRRWIPIGAAVIIVAGAFVGGWFAQRGVASDDDPAMNAAMTYGRGGQLPEFSVSSGSGNVCISGGLQPGRKITSDLTIDCDSPHELELYAWTSTYARPTGGTDSSDADYPGEGLLTAYGQDWCTLVFHTNLDPAAATGTKLRFTTLVPTAQEWRHPVNADSYDENAGRTLYCIVSAADGGQLKGSVQPNEG